MAVKAGQSLRAGEKLVVRVGFEDERGKTLVAALPFCLTVVRPDGKAEAELYRSTSREGAFGMAYPIPLNAPAGEWKVAVRSQLTGDVAELPVTVKPPRRIRPLAHPGRGRPPLPAHPQAAGGEVLQDADGLPAQGLDLDGPVLAHDQPRVPPFLAHFRPPSPTPAAAYAPDRPPAHAGGRILRRRRPVFQCQGGGAGAESATPAAYGPLPAAQFRGPPPARSPIAARGLLAV